MRRFASLLFVTFWALLFALGQNALAYRPPILRIGFIPSENSQEITRQVRPLIAYLHHALGISVTAFVPTDYPGVIEAMRSHMVDAAFLSPGAFVVTENECKRLKRPFFIKPLLKVVRYGRDTYYSAIIVRADSGIHTLAQLRGKRFAFGDPESMAGSLFAKVMLRKAGIDPKRDLKLLPPGGHDATVMAVFNHQADAGAVFSEDPKGKVGAWTLFLKTPAERRQIVPIAFSRPIPDDMFCVRNDLDPRMSQALEHSLERLSATAWGRNLLHRVYDIDGFTLAHSSDYDSVREALRH